MRERNERERLKKQQDYDDNMTEIANHIFGDTLTENPAVAQSAFGPHRVIPDRWKGMSPQQLEDIRREQEKQRLEKEVCIILSLIHKGNLNVDLFIFHIWQCMMALKPGNQMTIIILLFRETLKDITRLQ